MPIPIVATVAVTVAKNPAAQKVIIGAVIVIPLVLTLLLTSLTASIMGNSGASNSAAQAAIEAACVNSAEGTQALNGTTAYEPSGGGDALLAFLYEKGLTWHQARIAWALGMRESSGTNVTSSSGSFNGADYGIWQINKTHAEFIEDKWGWSMDDVGGDANKNYTVLMWFSQRLKNPVSWGLAANQEPNSVNFDWNRYTGKWQQDHRKAAEEVYIKWYNQFPDAVRKSGLDFAGNPGAGRVPTTAPTFVYTTAGPSPAPKPAGKATTEPAPKPTLGPVAPSPSESITYYVVAPENPLTVITDPFALVGTAKDGTGEPTVRSRSSAMVVKAIDGYPDGLPPPGALSLSNYPVLRYGEGTETFQAGGRSWTVAQQFVPLFRGFLMDWAASPYLGGGRFPLNTGDSGHHYVRKARISTGQWSDHASATAVDIRYDIMPQRSYVRHMTGAETAAVHQLLKKYPQLGWGGDYSLKNMDEMHFYVRGGVPAASVQSLAATTFIYTDGSTDNALTESGKLYDRLSGYPFEVDNVKGRTIEQAIGTIRQNPRVTNDEAVVGAFVYALGNAEVKIGEETVKENEESLAADPSATPKPVELLDPEKADRWISRAIGLAGTAPIIWIAPIEDGPSRDIFMERLNIAKGGYPNLTVLEVPREPSLGYVAENGDLTAEGEEWVADQVAQRVADSQPLYTEKDECQDLLFSASATGSQGVPSGEFKDRTDIVISTGAQQRDNLYSWIGVKRAPCPGGARCIGQAEALAAMAVGAQPDEFKNAKMHWDEILSTPSGEKGVAYPGDKSIPVGGLMFFETGKRRGHVATYVGNGMVVHNTVGKYGAGVYEEPAEAVAARYPYLGWATPVYSTGAAAVVSDAPTPTATPSATASASKPAGKATAQPAPKATLGPPLPSAVPTLAFPLPSILPRPGQSDFPFDLTRSVSPEDLLNLE